MKNLLTLILTISALALAALAQTAPEGTAAPAGSKGQTVKADDPKVIVNVYRYKAWMGKALEPPFLVDDVKIAKMDNGTFFKVKLDPGKHTFQSNDKQAGIVLDLKPGEEHYIRVEIAEGLWKGKGRLVIVPKEQGAFELQKLKPLKKAKIFDASRVFTEDVAVAKSS